MKISILHPSWKRPEMAMECYREWMIKADNIDEIEYILSLSDIDPHLSKYKEIFAGSEAKLIYSETNGLITQANAAAEVSLGNLLVTVSDDFSCPPNWDKILLEALEGKSDYLVKTDDGAQPWIITLPIMDRAYYIRFGYVYHPAYHHMFCDTEMTHVGAILGKIITVNALFPHNHYTTGAMVRDEVNIQNDATWAQGEELYFSRIQKNFDLPADGTYHNLDPNLPHMQWLKSKGVNI